MVDSNKVLSWAKITRRQLDNWVEKGYLRPVNAPGNGWRGTAYDWSMAEAKVAQRMGALTAAGIAPAMAAQFARGDRAALDRVLRALAHCCDELRWRHVGEAGVPPETEPCD